MTPEEIEPVITVEMVKAAKKALEEAKEVGGERRVFYGVTKKMERLLLGKKEGKMKRFFNVLGEWILGLSVIGVIALIGILSRCGN